MQASFLSFVVQLSRIRTDIYYISFPKDRLFTKCLVSVIYILETAQTAMLGYDAFEMLAKGFRSVDALDSLQNEWLTVPIFTGVCEFA